MHARSLFDATLREDEAEEPTEVMFNERDDVIDSRPASVSDGCDVPENAARSIVKLRRSWLSTNVSDEAVNRSEVAVEQPEVTAY